MQKYFLSVIIILLMTIAAGVSQVFAQKSAAINFVNDQGTKQIANGQTGSYPIAGSDLLGYQYKEVADFLKANPGYIEKQRLMKTSAWNFTVGSTRVWPATDFTTNGSYSVPSTCRAVGVHCYIFVADDAWGTQVDSNAVATIMNDFDNHTPANPNKGIFQTDVDTFGNPPDVDNDPRIIILILDVKDGYTGSGGYVAGYFSPSMELKGAGFAAEIYYMDCNPTNLKTTEGLNVALSTAAHEFQHMINFNYHYNFSTGVSNGELTFVNEGLSMVAEIVNGYGASMQDLFAAEPNHYLFDWRGSNSTLVLNDYARAQRYFLYCMEQFGVGSLKEFVQDYTKYGFVGSFGLDAIFKQNYNTSLGKVFLNFEIANGLNNRNVNTAYGYNYQPIPITVGTTLLNPNTNLTSGNLSYVAADYLTFTNSSNLSITFTPVGTPTNLIVKALEIGTSASRVVDVPLGTAFTEPAYPSTYNTIRFALIDTNSSYTLGYTYKSSGIGSTAEQELKWDVSEPTGYYVWTASDTICVTFDAYPGGKLDSIRVALRKAGSITGGVWQFTGSPTPTPLGKLLAGPFTASISTTNPPSGQPYPVPWQNWSKVDLGSSKVSTDQKFAVGFIIGSDPSVPGVMITRYPSGGAYHSYSYLQAADLANSPGSSPGWYYITSGTDTVAVYLVRAYVSLIVNGVKQEVELTPTSYSLTQNYPNPFNPSTKIDFALPVSGNVRITVYNQLGQKVMLLTDGVYSAGAHELSFNAANLASGVYYYRIETGTFSQTKKMVLLK